jgi:serine protease Do
MRRILATSIAIAFGLGVLAACTSESLADGGVPASKQLWRDPPAHPPATGSVPAQASLAPLVKALQPAVVSIYTTTVVKHPRVPGFHGRRPRGGEGEGEGGDPWQEFFERYFGAPREMPEEFRGNGLGSGFVISPNGYVLTNNHVVQNATDIRVRLHDNREFAAKVIGRDPPLDVALIKLEDAKDLPTVPIGDSDALEPGDFVLALGSPLNFRGSATFGIVSAKDRTAVTGSNFDDFIQTDAAINPGNSGGPLFNMRGDVVGINTAIVSPQIGQGIGFAVPINLAKQVLPQLQSKGKVARGYLGVSVSEMTPDLAQGFGLPEKTQGALVQQVVPKTPAAKAGIKEGDVVVALNGKPIRSSSELTRSVVIIPPGGKAQLTVLRGSEKKDITVTVAQRPEEEVLARGEGEPGEGPGEAEGGAQAKSPKEAKLGLKLADLTAERAKQMGLEGTSGVLVAEVSQDGPAARAGIERGDLILEVNRQPVSRPAQVVDLVKKMKAGQVAVLRVRRGKDAIYLPVRIEGKGEEKK